MDKIRFCLLSLKKMSPCPPPSVATGGDSGLDEPSTRFYNEMNWKPRAKGE